MPSGHGRDRDLRDKVMIGSNGLDLKRCAEELDALGLRDQTKERVLRLNALESRTLINPGTWR